MPQPEVDTLVIGAGVSGLTTAVQLVESGLRVRVWSADPPETTTSMAAGAMWGPYLVEPVDRVRTWSYRTLEVLRGLAAAPGTGVKLVPGVEATRTPVAPPEWGEQLDGFRMCGPSELPDGFLAGWRFTAPLVDMPVYLAFLRRRLADAGVTIEIHRIGSLDEVAKVAPVVVNCTGIGARDVVPDPELTAIRGQVVIVENPGITEFFAEDTGLSPHLLNIYPQGDTVVLGGLAVANDYRLEPDLDTSAAILARCADVEPRLRNARILEHRVGLRPTRSQVRVEAETIHGATVIHNYGHGGAGVTLSWGCAAEVARLLSSTP